MSETGFVFTTDNKVRMLSSEVEVNDKLSSILGEKLLNIEKNSMLQAISN